MNEKNVLNDEQLVKNIKNNEKINIPKPILKWVGGKTQLLEKLIVEFPVKINNYHEIFLGGGSVLFTVLTYIKEGIIILSGKIYVYDINEPLIYIYKNIQSSHNELYNTLQVIINEYNECENSIIKNRKPQNINEAKQSNENYYYWIRNKYNKLSLEEKKSVLGSALFIFLNKTCFRGLFRVGPNGFNVPFGNYSNPEIINKDHLDKINNLIQCVIFECIDFSVSLTKIEENDFVYLDPPYALETKKSFVGYTKEGFNNETHIKLFNLLHKLTEQNKKFMLSNSDVLFVREKFTNIKYNINTILCKRTINSKNPDAKTNEVIITNY